MSIINMVLILTRCYLFIQPFASEKRESLLEIFITLIDFDNSFVDMQWSLSLKNMSRYY